MGFIGIALWALIPGFIAKKKGRNFWGYYFLSFLISPLITMIITLCLSKKDDNPLLRRTESLNECKSCGYRAKKLFTVCPKCGKDTKQNIYLNEEPTIDVDQILFCRKCGEKLIESGKFCSKCGTQVIAEPVTIVSEQYDCEFCKKCGAVISDDTDTCHVCGERKDAD